MSSLKELESNASSSSSKEDLPPRLPKSFIACDTYAPQEKVIQSTLGHYGFPLATHTNNNLEGTKKADIILLGCKPWGYKDILTEPGMQEALSGKIILSILAGVKTEQLEDVVNGGRKEGEEPCTVVRVMPNTASFVRESMTVIETKTPALSPERLSLVTWIFSRIGRVVHLPPKNLDACTALGGSGPAFAAIMLEALADGGVAMGIPRAEAQLMAAQVMKGTASLVLNGEHPAVLKDKVSTPGGCTIGGLMVLEEGAVRGNVARAVREATIVASELGGGKAGFANSTRH